MLHQDARCSKQPGARAIALANGERVAAKRKLEVRRQAKLYPRFAGVGCREGRKPGTVIVASKNGNRAACRVLVT